MFMLPYSPHDMLPTASFLHIFRCENVGVTLQVTASSQFRLLEETATGPDGQPLAPPTPPAVSAPILGYDPNIRLPGMDGT